MSWRRRLLGTSALLGVSVLCLRPVLTIGIERRLSEQLRLPVSVGDTRLAMSQNSLQLTEFRIDDERCPLTIDELLLRLDGNALLYRNCVVESFVGSGLRWYLPVRSESESSTPIPMVSASGESVIKDIQQVFSQTLGAIKTAESLSVDRSREIDRKLEAIKTKIDEAIYRGPISNPLRGSPTVEKLRSDVLAIQSLIAIDRVEAAKIDAVAAQSLEQLSVGLETAKGSMPTISVTANEISHAIITEAMRLVSESINPYTLAAETGYQRFLNQWMVEGGEVPNSSSLFRAGRELVTEQIPLREFALKKGRITGETTLGEKNLQTEIAISSIRIKRHDSNVLQISWKDGQTEGAETVCRIGPSLGADNTVTHLLNLTQKDSGFQAAVQVDYKPGYRDVLVSFPMSQVLGQIQDIDQELLQEAKRICEERQVVYSARTRVDSSETTLVPRSDWTAQSDSSDEVYEVIESAMDHYLSQQREAWLNQTQSVYSNCKNLIESRKTAMEEERSIRYSKWTDVVKDMESKLSSLSNNSRSALSRDSGLMR